MAKDKIYEAMKEIAKNKGIKASPYHDLYKMCSPCFLNAFYCDFVDRKAKKMKMQIHYDVKCAYFDDLKLYMIEPNSTVKITDKVRANSVIQFKSIINKEDIEFDFDGSDESYVNIAKKTFEHIEKWYHDFFDDVKGKYGNLEQFFISNQDEFPLQAAFVYVNQEKYDLAESCMNKLTSNLNSSRLINPETKEQEMRLKASNAQDWGNCYQRDDMDCIRDYITAKKKGLEWTPERARYGLLKEERDK